MPEDRRWSRIDELFSAALDVPPAERSRWIEEACAGDAELRAEVEKLLQLSQHDDDSVRPGGAMEGPLWEELASELDPESTEGLSIGARVGPYEIVGTLGSGGMGTVYRAKHPVLDRQVAVKALPSALASEPFRRRFEREAKLLASLNHPNIAAIYDLLLLDDQPYLILELVEGQTLEERLSRGPLEMDELLAIATQVADALEDAHRKGIVHRDLKPSNVKLTPEGRVKVLDFGLAKSRSPARDESQKPPPAGTDPVTTESGTVLGTPGYMSPEQARGLAVDHRTDVWAFGCLLYEMLTGKRAFRGETASDVLAAVLRDPIDRAFVPQDTPTELTRLMETCLEKDPRERPRDLSGPRRVLLDLAVAPEAGSLGGARELREGKPLAGTRGRMGGALLLVMLVMVVAVAGYLLTPDEPSVPRLTNPVQITSAVGREDFPTWSPDGRMLAYAAMQEGNWDVWVVELATGSSINRTADYTGTDVSPSWSPDGREIAFLSSRDGGGIFLLPSGSGPPRKLAVRKDVATLRASPQWSRDGSELAYTVLKEGAEAESLEILSVSTGRTRQYALPGRSLCRCEIRWSPDSRLIAYVDAEGHDVQVSQIWVLRLEDGRAIPVTDGWSSDWSPSWSADGRTLFYVSNRGGSMDLWQQAMGPDGVPRGDPQRITVGVGMQRAVFSPDGKKLVYSKGQRVGNLYRVPILRDRPATWADAEQLTFDTALVEFVDVSPDGTELAVSSDRAGNSDLWLLDVKGGEMHQLTSDPRPDWQPVWSPDGKQIAFYAYRSGNRDLWVMPSGGGEARQLTRDPSSDLAPSWSPDGSKLAFASSRDGSFDIWVTPTDGGPAARIVDASSLWPRWSPDGKWIVFSSFEQGVSSLWRVPSEGGPPERLSESPANYAAWSADGTRIYFNSVRGDENLWEIAVDGRGERSVTDFRGRRGRLGREALATDGHYLYFTWQEDLGDLWVMDVIGRKAPPQETIRTR